jgi:hypothetical protein
LSEFKEEEEEEEGKSTYLQADRRLPNYKHQISNNQYPKQQTFEHQFQCDIDFRGILRK